MKKKPGAFEVSAHRKGPESDSVKSPAELDISHVDMFSEILSVCSQVQNDLESIAHPKA